MVDFEAAKSGLLGVDTSHMDAVKKILKQGWNLLVPLIILIVCLAFFQFTVARSATLAILATIIACALKKETRMSFKTILDGFETGVIRSVSVICAVASAGVAIGCIMLTGVGAKFAFAVLTLAHNNLFLTLLMSGLAATILGMGLPTVAAYIISASLLASSLVQLGTPLFAAHMFLLYYSILSQITPPVALAAYAAGNIADANPNKVGFTAMRLGIIAFIIPFRVRPGTADDRHAAGDHRGQHYLPHRLLLPGRRSGGLAGGENQHPLPYPSAGRGVLLHRRRSGH